MPNFHQYQKGDKVVRLGSGQKGIFQRWNQAHGKNEVLVNSQLEEWGPNEILPAPPKPILAHIDKESGPPLGPVNFPKI